jgi:hypothetical protein
MHLLVVVRRQSVDNLLLLHRFLPLEGGEIGKIKKNDQRCDFFENRGCGFYWLGLEAPSPAANNATVARLGRTETDGLIW